MAVGGRVASGNSTLAKALAPRFAAPLVVADAIREALTAPLPAGVAHEIAWDSDFVARIYDALLGIESAR